MQDKPLFRQTFSSVSRDDQPESPNTVLRRTLNIAPPAPVDTGQQISPVDGRANTFQPVKAAMPDLPASALKPPNNSSAVMTVAAKVDSLDHVHADVTSTFSQPGLVTPQALLQTHLTAKVS